MKETPLASLEFYENLSDSYDQMISWPARIGAEGMFFKKLVTDYKLKSSLDIACSTGFHVIMLRRLGLDAVGIDASPKMIEKAKTNSVTCGVTVEYILGDFTAMSKRFSEGFDLITCLGDTVSHIQTRQDLKKTFHEAYKCLNPGGLFVLQCRNYDHILKQGMRFMPPTGSRNGTEETFFFRLLDFHPKSLNLNIVRFRWHENRWESDVQTTVIYPYLKKELESTLKSAGFNKLTCYRNYNFEDYDPNGSDTVIVAVKTGTLKPRTTSSVNRRERTAVKSSPTQVKPAVNHSASAKASKSVSRKVSSPKAATHKKRKGKK